MENGNKKTSSDKQVVIRDFKDLLAWQFARTLRMKIYEVSSRFPKAETFALSSQIRRAAISVSANIAEGYGRFSYQENIRYCRQSPGSIYELRDHLTCALDAGYITQAEYQETETLALSVTKLINGYIRSTRLKGDNTEVSQ